MDFADFQEDPALKKAIINPENQLPTSYVNYGHGLFNVGLWNSVVTVTMAVPVAAYIEALKHTPVYLGDNSWKWEYSVVVGENTYLAKLLASRISNEEFKAEMYISNNGMGGYSDFKWFEGIIRYDRTHAIWSLNESADNPAEWLEIEWNMDWEKEVSDITYTITKAGDDEYGSFINYAITDNAIFDAAYTVSGSSNTINIEWNRTTYAGRIKDPVKFSDEAWHCWNNLLEDIDCE